MTTRKHVLDSGTLAAKLPEDPIAGSYYDDVRIWWSSKMANGAIIEGLSPRQARQLAYLLCEAADEAER